MSQPKSIKISIAAALKLVDMIQDQARQTDNELVKKILLRAGIKIADLAINGQRGARKLIRAA